MVGSAAEGPAVTQVEAAYRRAGDRSSDRSRLLRIRLGRQVRVVVLDHVQHLAGRFVLDLVGLGQGRPSAGATPPAFLGSSPG